MFMDDGFVVYRRGLPEFSLLVEILKGSRWMQTVGLRQTGKEILPEFFARRLLNGLFPDDPALPGLAVDVCVGLLDLDADNSSLGENAFYFPLRPDICWL